MTLAETSPPAGPAPTVSVLVTTYNRSVLLRRALASILQQDFESFEIVVVDDKSTDDTPEVMRQYGDPRIRYIRNAENMARKGGDRSIFQRFVNEQARGEFFLWLCDDDYWLPSDLLSRQVAIMRDNPTVAMVFGAMAQLFPTPAPLPPAVPPYLRYEYLGGCRDITFAHGVYPSGHMGSETFLDLFADYPSHRNSVTGGTMFRASSFRKADALARGADVRWQSGYLMLAGTATAGDVWFIDEPCVVASVDIDSASFRGTQIDHMLDSMRSVEAAFQTVLEEPDGPKRSRMLRIRTKMMRSVFRTFLLNKISHRLGQYPFHPKGIEKTFEPEIATMQFLSALRRHGVPVTWGIRAGIALSAMPGGILRLLHVVRRQIPNAMRRWLFAFPDDFELTTSAAGDAYVRMGGAYPGASALSADGGAGGRPAPLPSAEASGPRP
jgi:hypothetical protein